MRTKVELQHPLKSLGLSMAEIARQAGVNRIVLTQVVNGDRNRPGVDSILTIVGAFPELSLEQLASWKWPADPKKKARKSKKTKTRRAGAAR
jgi:transcriptional regulator with XRE-family HTH domain